MPRSSADDPGLAARLRAVASDALELAHIRLELFTLEAREEFSRLLLLAAFAVGGAIAVSFGLVFLAVFVTALLWDTHRLLTLGIFTAVFLGGGCVLLGLAWARIKGLARMFAATRGELRRDRERLLQTPADGVKKGEAS